MKSITFSRVRVITLLTLLLTAIVALTVGAAAQGNTPIDRILKLLTDSNFGLAEIKREVAVIESEVSDPTHGLAEIKSEIQAIEAKLSPTSFKLSSGLFDPPANARAFMWMGSRPPGGSSRSSPMRGS